MISKIHLQWALLFLLLAGCATDRHIGAREFPLLITTSKNNVPFSGATVYVVPNDEWLHYGKDLDDPGCRKFLAAYKVTDGKTPVTIYGVSKQMVVVVDWNNHLTRTSSPAVPGDHPSVNIEVN